MFDTVLIVDQAVSGLLLLAWLLAAVRVAGLRHRTADRLPRSARRTLVLVSVAMVAVVAKLVTVVLLAGASWEIAANRVWVELPLLLPVVAVVVGTMPRLLRLGRSGRGDAGASRLVVPAQSTAAGAALAAYAAIVAVPAPPYAIHLGPLAALLAAATALSWWRRHAAPGRPLRRPAVRLASAAGVLAVLATALVAGAQASRLPDRSSMTAAHAVDLGGGPAPEHAAHHGGVSVLSLTGPRAGAPDVRFTLTAGEQAVPLSSGAVADALTFNGQAPGPELRVREGDLVEVTLRNTLSQGGVTVHWHGLDVPNAEDGVAGLTQDAVSPGGQHVYRFRAEQVGTFWYHSHQLSSVQVRRGLFGVLVVLPRAMPDTATDITLVSHTWRTDRGDRTAFGTADTVTRRGVAAGTPVRLRLVNTDAEQRGSGQKTFILSGAPFRVAAIDGVDLVGPTDLIDTRLGVARGGRHDLTFRMPDGPVWLGDGDEPGVGLLLSPDGGAEPPAPVLDAPLFDPASYGRPAATPFDAGSAFDREFTLLLGDRIGFYDGEFGDWSTINGASAPDAPMLVVAEGDLVRMTFVNRSHETHPMHLHGHHALVLSRNGEPVSGSPWWTDTLDVVPGETFEVAFRADNPGLWMAHCHNLEHAAGGMTLHLSYAGVGSPFEVGRATGNQPE